MDEGYYAVLRPVDTDPSLAEVLRSLQVADATFEFHDDAFPVEAIVRMSPKLASLMRTCGNMQSADRNVGLDHFPRLLRTRTMMRR